MAANPYITIPAGNINQQNMLIQAYYRNLALQNQYAQQQYQYDQQGHQWENALALGVGKGIGSGFDQYLGAVDQTAKFNQQNQLQMFSDVNQAQRQHDLFAQQDAAQTEREQAAAQAEQRRALLAEVFKQREQAQRGAAFQGVFGAMQPQSVTAPPADYNDVSQTTVTPGQSVQQAIMGLGPSQAGLLPNEFYQKAMETPKAGGLTESEALARYKEVQALVDSGNPEAAQRLQASLAGSAYGGALPTAKPPTPTRFPVNATFGSYLQAHGVDTLEQYHALPQPTRTQLFNDYSQWDVSQQGQKGAMIEAAKLQVNQPAPPAEQDKLLNLGMTESTLANIATLVKKVDLTHIAGFFPNALADLARTGQWHGIPIPEDMRPTLSADELALLSTMDYLADQVLRKQSGGQTTEGEFKRMLGFLVTGKATPPQLLASITVMQRGLDRERQLRTNQFTVNHWIVPEDTTFTHARQTLRQNNKPYDDTAVQLFLQSNPGYR